MAHILGCYPLPEARSEPARYVGPTPPVQILLGSHPLFSEVHAFAAAQPAPALDLGRSWDPRKVRTLTP